MGEQIPKSRELFEYGNSIFSELQVESPKIFHHG